MKLQTVYQFYYPPHSATKLSTSCCAATLTTVQSLTKTSVYKFQSSLQIFTTFYAPDLLKSTHDTLYLTHQMQHIVIKCSCTTFYKVEQCIYSIMVRLTPPLDIFYFVSALLNNVKTQIIKRDQIDNYKPYKEYYHIFFNLILELILSIHLLTNSCFYLLLVKMT